MDLGLTESEGTMVTHFFALYFQSLFANGVDYI